MYAYGSPHKDMTAKYDIFTYCQKTTGSWTSESKTPSLHLFSIDVYICVCVCVCVFVIWAVKCIYQNWCSNFRGIVKNKLHYRKVMSTIYDKYTYPVNMTKGS